MRFRIKHFLLIIAAIIGFAPVAFTAAAFETKAKQVIIVDYDTGTELFAKAADAPMEPASMTKMMTVYLLFEQLKNGNLSLEDTLLVSKKAWKKPGSKMFIEVGKRIKVEDLIRGIVVQSGNDASITVAEGLAGSEAAFAELMTKKARELGMANTTFRNSSGWPDKQHVTTARDLATLAVATIRDFPDYFHHYAETSFTYNGIKQGNRNPLLYKNIGADGLKTGHTERSGYGVAASVKRGKRRVVLVAHGMKSVRERSREAERLIDWSYREFNSYPLLAAAEKVTNARVWLGSAETVPLQISRDLVVVMKRSARRKLKVIARLDEPVPAPIKKGMEIGRLVVTAPDLQPIERPLIAGADVGSLGAFGRLQAAVGYLIWGPGD
ncbi:MAG: D-alanyl-D-alanine carboxypeptidase [Alphaproteobacteria bacterium]|nr:D-alanyl-D-alanine carboxypeptidase [Alphaproteobacteria bacterium]